MISIKSNSRGVAISIERSLKAKIRGVDNAIDNWLAVTKNEIVNNAENNDSAEKDDLAKAIKHNKKERIVYVDDNLAPFAPYIEFGTKTKFNRGGKMRSELAIVAAKYRGKEIDFPELVERVARTGIAKDPRAVAVSIAFHGTRPRPFFYNAVYGRYPELKRSLKRSLRRRR